MLLVTTHNLKLMNCLFLDFPFNIFGPWLTPVTETMESKTMDKDGLQYNENIIFGLSTYSCHKIFKNSWNLLNSRNVFVMLVRLWWGGEP